VLAAAAVEVAFVSEAGNFVAADEELAVAEFVEVDLKKPT